VVIYFWKNSDKIQDEIHKNSAAAATHATAANLAHNTAAATAHKEFKCCVEKKNQML
jgi:hypothetical protein